MSKWDAFVFWYHLCYLKNVKNTQGGLLLSVKLQAEACNFTKCNTPLWVFYTFLKLCKWHQIAQSITYVLTPQLYTSIMRRTINSNSIPTPTNDVISIILHSPIPRFTIGRKTKYHFSSPFWSETKNVKPCRHQRDATKNLHPSFLLNPN